MARFTFQSGRTRQSYIDGSAKSGWAAGLTAAHDAKNQGIVDLQADEELACSATAARHSKLESTVRYLGIEVDDALEMTEQTDV